jgi:hypothetical protein
VANYKRYNFWEIFNSVLEPTLPNNQHSPLHVQQLLLLDQVTLPVPLKLFSPLYSIGSGGICVMTSMMLMPEASMHENDQFVLWQDQVRFAR